MPTRSGAPCLGHPRLPTPSSNEFLEEQANANTLSTSSTKRKRTAASENKVFIAPVKTPRKKANTTKRAPAKTVDPTDEALDPKPEPKPKKPRTKKPEQEKRLKMFRKHAPQTYLEKLARATSQRYGLVYKNKGVYSLLTRIFRMFVVSSLVNWTDEYPIMEFGMAGTTGNLYTVIIGKVPSCSCPDNQKGNQCKHICYGTFNLLPIISINIIISILMVLLLTSWPIKS